MELLTTMKVYFMVELETMPRYKFVTFTSEIIRYYKLTFALVSNKQIVWIAEFTQS